MLSEILRGKTGGGAAGGRPEPGGNPLATSNTLLYSVMLESPFFVFMGGCLQKNDNFLHIMEKLLVARVTLLLKSDTKRYHLQDHISSYKTKCYSSLGLNAIVWDQLLPNWTKCWLEQRF